MKRNIIYSILVTIIFIFASCRKDELVAKASLDVKEVEIDVTYTTAIITWNVLSNATIEEVVLEYSTDSAFAKHKEVQMAKVENKEKQYRVALQSLSEGTTYYVRCRAINKINSCESEISVFTTTAYSLASIRTDSITGITISSAELHATLLDWGTDSLPQVGFCIATHANATIEDSGIICQLTSVQDSISYITSLNDLDDNVTYYVRAFARNSKGLSYGEEVSFITMEIVTPEIGNTTISSIAYSTATIASEVLSDGGAEVLERGVCYSTTQGPTVTDDKMVNGSGIGTFTCRLTGLTPGFTYYIRAFATNIKGVSYGEELEFDSPTFIVENGALPGEFSVSDTKKVRFSQGNLQYRASTQTWRFATNQYDFVGNNSGGNVYENGIKCTNALIGDSYSGWIDLFGWGTSGYDNIANDSAANNFQPWCYRTSIAPNDSTLNCEVEAITGQCEWEYTYPSTQYNKYGYGPSTNMPDQDLTGTSVNYDWGIYNPISNGGNMAGHWRVLSKAEWTFLINGRSNAMYLYSIAKVGENYGIILLPDNFSKPTNIEWQPAASDWNTNVYSLEQWQIIANAGGVFLPAAYVREEQKTSRTNSLSGHWFDGYWSRTRSSASSAYYFRVDFLRTKTDPMTTRYTYYGYSVRLVQDVQ